MPRTPLPPGDVAPSHPRFDQLNVKNLVCFENVLRRVVTLEIAIERCPKHLDFTGLEEIAGGPITSAGNARVSKFMEFVTTRQRDKAQIWKQARLYRDERHKLGRGWCGGAADDSPEDPGGGGSDGRGGGKGKKKKKGGKGDGKHQAGAAAE